MNNLTEEEIEVDVEEERIKFISEHGKSPEKWLEEWRSGNISRTAQHYSVSFWASFLYEE